MKRLPFLLFVLVFAILGATWLVYSRAAGTYNLNTYPVYDSQATHNLQTIGSKKMLERDSVTGFFTWEEFTSRWAIHFHDTATGQVSNVPLPNGASSEASIWATDNTVWAIGGNPIKIYHFSLTGAPLPTSMSLLSTESFGDADSRADDILQLESGAIVALYHQQGQTGPQGDKVLYRPAGSQTWQNVSLTAMITNSSKAMLVQHPADKSIWFFRDPDAWGSIEATRLVESANGLTVDWTNAQYISGADGEFDADPENPDLKVAPDPASGEIVVAYESAHRQRFTATAGGSSGIGSYPAIARIKADKSKSFYQLPTYVERISSLGLVVRPGEVWLAYRPISLANGFVHFEKAYASLYRNGVWEPPVYLGDLKPVSETDLYRSWQVILSGISRPEFVTDLRTGSGASRPTFLSFLNAGPIGDQQPPATAITAPAAGASLSGQVAVTATSTDNIGVSRTELYVDNALYATDTTAPYSFTWDTTKFANASHSLQTKAYDSANNVGSSAAITVTVNNYVAPPPDTTKPVVTINSPLNGSSIRNSVIVAAAATDNLGVKKMEVYVDNQLKTTTIGSSLNYTWDSKRADKGVHTIIVKAYDAAGNIGVSQVSVSK